MVSLTFNFALRHYISLIISKITDFTPFGIPSPSPHPSPHAPSKNSVQSFPLHFYPTKRYFAVLVVLKCQNITIDPTLPLTKYEEKNWVGRGNASVEHFVISLNICYCLDGKMTENRGFFRLAAVCMGLIDDLTTKVANMWRPFFRLLIFQPPRATLVFSPLIPQPPRAIFCDPVSSVISCDSTSHDDLSLICRAAIILMLFYSEGTMNTGFAISVVWIVRA